MARSRTMDLTRGSILKQMLIFALPIMAGNLLQQLYTVADRVVVGQFAADGTSALAAVGASAQPVNLTLGLFMGIAAGSSVICANMIGSRDASNLKKNMHTAVLLGGICGLALSVIAIPLVPLFLAALGTPEAIMDQAVLYMQIYLVGIPASLLYNICAGILRAHGDTKRPMYCLSVSGIVNVGLNLLLVVGLHLDVAGVAVATVISQYLSAGVLLWIMFSPKDQYQLTWSQLRLDKTQAKEIFRIGIPAGLGGMVFSASNLAVQSAVNSFNNPVLMAGKTAANDINTFVYQIHGAFSVSCVSFAGQCYGARKYKRIDRVAITGIWLGAACMSVLILPCMLWAPQVIGLFNQDPAAQAYGARFLRIMLPSLFLFTPSECCLSCSRGMRRATMPTVLNLIAICGVRVLWVIFIFPHHRSIEGLYLSLPVSWIVSCILQVSYYIYSRRKLSCSIKS